jgi:curved DNA-binding protein CbpA
MVTDPYQVLGLPVDADDETIRRRYLELVKEFPPDHHAARFNEIRQAYEQLKDLETRLRDRLFEVAKPDELTAIIAEVEGHAPRPRRTLQQLLEMTRRP